MNINAELKVWKKIEEQRETGIQQSALSACVGRQIAIHRETRENQEWQLPKQNYKECAPVVVSCLCPFGEMLVSDVSVWACSWVSSWVTRWDDSGIAIDEKTSRWQEKQNSKPKDKLEFQAPPPLFFTQLHGRGLWVQCLPFPSLSGPCKFLFCSPDSKAKHHRDTDTSTFTDALFMIPSYGTNLATTEEW